MIPISFFLSLVGTRARRFDDVQQAQQQRKESKRLATCEFVRSIVLDLVKTTFSIVGLDERCVISVSISLSLFPLSLHTYTYTFSIVVQSSIVFEDPSESIKSLVDTVAQAISSDRMYTANEATGLK